MSEAEPIRFGPSPSPAEAQEPTPAPAWAYLLRCPDGSLYGGWTNDLARRLKAHRSGKGGARYTKSHGRDAVRLAYAEKCADKSAALKREAAIKKLPKADKEALAARWAADNKITLRMATPDDAAAVCALYNWYVRHGTQTFQYAPSTVEEYRANIAHVRENAPFILAESADGRLQGFACAHLWHEREAYSWDVETTVYCAPDCVGQGVGGRLYRALLALLKAQGYYNAFALVAGNNRQSNDFHRAMGFKKMATEKRTGYKFGQWLDLEYWVMNFYKLDPDEEMIVIFDDISLEPGRIRIRKKGSAGGHNGIKSIIAMTGTQGFSRIKVGVGEKPQGWDLADHVLGRFSSEDRAKVEEAIGHAMDAAVLMMQGETDKAMNIYN